MAHYKIMFRVLLSSPSDLTPEREIVSKIVEEINSANKETPFGIELFRWENDTDPAIILDDGQKSIDKTFNYKHSELLIGMFYKKLGVGTVHEIDEAIESYKKYGYPEIKLYFKKISKSLDKTTPAERAEFESLSAKKHEYMSQGIIQEFRNKGDFESKFRKHIQRFFDNEKNKYSREPLMINDFLGQDKFHINSYKLFYQRTHIKNYKLKDVSTLTGISLSKLRKYEMINVHALNDTDIFPIGKVTDIRKIESVLDINQGGLILDNNDLNYETQKNYYVKNKGINKSDIEANTTNKKYDIIVFDFDGTIVDANSMRSTWQKIWIKLGYTLSDCQKLHEKFDKKEINHQEWCDITAEYFIKKSLNKSDLNDIIKEIIPINGLNETLQKLKSADIKLYIVSGSIKEIIYPVLGDNAKYFEDISANIFHFDKTGALTRIEGTEYDFEGKAEYIRKLSDHTGVPTRRILFIGNSHNDAHVYKSGARTLCINPTQTNSHNKKYWNNSLESVNDLQEILNYCLN